MFGYKNEKLLSLMISSENVLGLTHKNYRKWSNSVACVCVLCLILRLIMICPFNLTVMRCIQDSIHWRWRSSSTHQESFDMATWSNDQDNSHPLPCLVWIVLVPNIVVLFLWMLGHLPLDFITKYIVLQKFEFVFLRTNAS